MDYVITTPARGRIRGAIDVIVSERWVLDWLVDQRRSRTRLTALKPSAPPSAPPPPPSPVHLHTTTTTTTANNNHFFVAVVVATRLHE